MSCLFILIAAMVAGFGYAEFTRRSLWDNVELECFYGCLVTVGAVTAFGVLWFVVSRHQGYWLQIILLFAGFHGIIFLRWFLEYLGELWKKRRGGDSF